MTFFRLTLWSYDEEDDDFDDNITIPYEKLIKHGIVVHSNGLIVVHAYIVGW
jgi:hypothetical protein